MIKNIFIDLDETLWATRENNKEALREVFNNQKWDTYFNDFESFFSKYEPHNDHVWDLYRKGVITKQELTIDRFKTPLLPEIELSDKEIMEINSEFLGRAAVKKRLLPGAIELLQELRTLYKLVIVSNGFEEVQAKKMDASGILPYIDYTILSEVVGANKPSPKIFNYAFSVSRSRPSETIMIGDSWDADIMGAEYAGIPAIWYNPQGLPTPRPLKVPIHIISSLDEVTPILRRYIIGKV